jgi:hypothetical protein
MIKEESISVFHFLFSFGGMGLSTPGFPVYKAWDTLPVTVFFISTAKERFLPSLIDAENLKCLKY